MKILLAAINAKYIHSNLALRDLKAYAEAHGDLTSVSIEIAEYTINQTENDILIDLYRREADVVLFSCYIWNMNYVRALVSSLHKVRSEVPIWLGGPEVSFHAEEILRNLPGAAGILRGEGELTFTRLAEAYQQYRAENSGDRNPTMLRPEVLRTITGITYRNPDGNAAEDARNRDVMSNPLTEPIAMDDIPFFYAGLPEFRQSADIIPAQNISRAVFANRILYYESSRGCPFRCSYCLSSLGERVRFRSLELVLPELQFFLDAGVPQVKFVDRTFNCRHSHAVGIWEYLRDHDNGITNFHFEIAADLLTAEEIALLGTLRPGQVQLEIGVQSTNPRTLREIDRVQDMNHLRQVTAQINAAQNIHQHLDLIVGLPSEDLQSFRKSFDEVFALKPDQLQLGFLKVLHGSAMERRCTEFGIRYQDHAPYEVLGTNWISYADIIRLKGIEEMTEVYWNSHQFPETMEKLIETGGSAFDTLDRLAEYYRANHLDQQSHSRPERFRILLDFTRIFDPVHAEQYPELLTYDLYLRENSKSRPAFAPGQGAEKKRFREYFRSTYGEKYDHRMLHGEVFRQNIGGWSGDGPWYVVFDYRRREPLSGNAHVSVISAGD